MAYLHSSNLFQSRIIVSSFLSMILLSLSIPVHAQVGPPSPPEKQVTPMNQALAKLLKKKKDEGSTTDSTAPAEEEQVDEKAEKPFFPSNGPGPSNQVPPTHHKKKKKAPKSAAPTADSSSTTPGNANMGTMPSTGVSPADDHPGLERPPLITPPPFGEAHIETPSIDTKNPPILTHPRLDDPHNPLGFRDSELKLKHYIDLISAHRYADARPGIMNLKQFLTDLTEAHIGLYKTLSQVASARAQAELEKELALQFAQLRDRAVVEAARVHIADKDYDHAIKELADVVKSQPRTRLGLHAYELLQEIGFTEKLQIRQE